jgi:hypothetical protein
MGMDGQGDAEAGDKHDKGRRHDHGWAVDSLVPGVADGSFSGVLEPGGRLPHSTVCPMEVLTGGVDKPISQGGGNRQRRQQEPLAT